MLILLECFDDRTIKGDVHIIGKENENVSTILKIIIPDDLANNDVFLEFEKADGIKLATQKLEALYEEKPYILFEMPNALLDVVGELLMEAVFRGANDYVFKSFTYKFHIKEAINASETLQIEYPDFVSEAVKALEQMETIVDTTGDGTKYLANDGTYKTVSGGASDYNSLENKPITILNETENFIYMKDLLTGLYLASGNVQPYDGADITITADHTLMVVLNDGTYAYVIFFDNLNNIEEWYKVAIDGSSYERKAISFNDYELKKRIYTISKNTLSTILMDNESYQISVALSRLILRFPSDMQVGYKSEIVFFTGDTLPSTFNIDMENIKWHGDSIVDNNISLKANKSYTIQFTKDVNNFIAEVREV